VADGGVADGAAAGIAGLTGPVGRVGIIVPRHRQTAVRRNLLKRRLRELVRLQLLPALRTGAVVIRARPEAYEATFAELARQIERVRRDAERLVGVS
jgi:ribonuclease P protein component